jgi:hypothetical protein
VRVRVAVCCQGRKGTPSPTPERSFTYILDESELQRPPTAPSPMRVLQQEERLFPARSQSDPTLLSSARHIPGAGLHAGGGRDAYGAGAAVLCFLLRPFRAHARLIPFQQVLQRWRFSAPKVL